MKILGGFDIFAGAILMFGAGGTLAELIKDRNLHALPLNQAQAQHLIMNSKIYQVLKGYRGDKAYAIDKLVDLLLKLAALAQDNENISEIEINPVIVTYDDVWAVDGKTILS